MDNSAPPNAHVPRLNPFAFPSDTDFRFVLLIVAVIGASLFTYNAIYLNVPANWAYLSSSSLRCWETWSDAFKLLPKNSSVFINPDFLAARGAFEQCLAPAYRSIAMWQIGGIILLLIVAGVIYWLLPSWKIWRERLAVLTTDDEPEMMAYLTELCHEAGLGHPPTFLLNPLNPACSGVTFGRSRRYYVALNGGLVTRFYLDLSVFRAVVLHELAHLKNADVDKTYFSIAVWLAFVFAALIPYAVTLIGEPLDYILNFGLRVLVLAALVYLTRNAILRVREEYADIRASMWDGPKGALRRVLESLPQKKMSTWRRVLQVHPDPVERRQVVDNTSRLFHAGFWLAFGTGFAVMVAVPNFITMLSSILTGIGRPDLAYSGITLIFAPLIAGVLGLAIWRATFGELIQGKGLPTGVLTLGLALGMILGQTFSLQGYIQSMMLGETTLTDNLAYDVASIPLWGLALVGVLFLLLQWIAMAAKSWLGVTVTSRSPRPIYIVGLAIAGLGMTICLAPIFLINDLGLGPFGSALFGSVGWFGILVSLTENPLTLLLVTSLWVFPLAAWFWRGQVSSASRTSWAFLDMPSNQLDLSPLTPLRPRFALMIGLSGGLLFCALLLLIRIVLRLALPEDLRSSEGFLTALFWANIGLAVVIQGVVAARVSALVKRLGWCHGLCAAFVAGCVMVVGILGLNLIFGGTSDLAFTWLTLSLTLNGGAFLALPVAWGVSTLSEWFRGSRAQTLQAAT